MSRRLPEGVGAGVLLQVLVQGVGVRAAVDGALPRARPARGALSRGVEWMLATLPPAAAPLRPRDLALKGVCGGRRDSRIPRLSDGGPSASAPLFPRAARGPSPLTRVHQRRYGGTSRSAILALYCSVGGLLLSLVSGAVICTGESTLLQEGPTRVVVDDGVWEEVIGDAPGLSVMGADGNGRFPMAGGDVGVGRMALLLLSYRIRPRGLTVKVILKETPYITRVREVLWCWRGGKPTALAPSIPLCTLSVVLRGSVFLLFPDHWT